MVNYKRAMFAGFFLDLLLVALVIFAQSANAQSNFALCVTRPFDPICQVMGPVYRQHEEIRVRRAIENGIGQAQNTADLYGYSGIGIGGGRVSRDIGAGLLGISVGGAFGGKKGVLVGGAAGVGAAELIGHFASRRGGSAAAGPSAGGGRGDFELSNSMRYPVDVYRRDQKGREKHLGRLSSGDVWAVEAPKPGEVYHGYVLIPNNSGGLSTDHLYPAPTTNGWEFVEPPEAVAQGGTR